MINILNIFKRKNKLTPEQYKLLNYIVNYGWHRANCHNTPLRCRKESIDKLRLSMGLIKTSKL